jgi:serine/threonine protein kinase
MYEDEVDEQGLPIAAPESDPGRDDLEEKESAITSTIHQSVAVNARSLQDMIAPGLWYMSDRHSDGDRHRDISQTEQDLFADLLGRLLEYKPEDRISAKDAINHAWFKL